MTRRSNQKIWIVISIVLMAFVSTSSAKVIYVDDDGPADFNNIQAAIDDSNNGDTIIVSDGTYTGVGNQDIDFLGKAITLRSENGPENCIIDCNGTEAEPHRGFYLHNGEDSNSVLEGFTITNGFGEHYGGGILCDSSSPTLINCIFSNNLANWYGGGMFCKSSSNPSLVNCTFIENRTNEYSGGGIYLQSSNPTFSNCIINRNSSENAVGGGICMSGSNPTFSNCLINRNSAENAGGIYLSASNPTIINCTIIDNFTYGDGGGITCWSSNPKLINCTIAGNLAGRYGGGIYSGYLSRPIITQCTITDNSVNEYGGGVTCVNSYAVIKSSILYGNIAENGGQLAVLGNSLLDVSYSNIQGNQSDVYVIDYHTLNWGDGNIDADPLFIDPCNRDYRLSIYSPCIDSAGPYYYLFGHYFTDMDGNCRLTGETSDMGSDEFGGLPDSDADLLSDEDETAYGSSPYNSDTDGDGLLDGVEVLRGTNPIVADSPSGISVPVQYSNIQQALFLAFPLETITVSPGIYYENLHFQGKNLILQSINPLDNEIVNNTVIDANKVGTVITFNGTENSSCVLSGFTIANGAFSGISGNGCGAVIQNNKIVCNFIPSLNANSGGGGMFNCDGIIYNNIISDNSASESGGGISRCNGTISNNIISNNTSGYSGGGIAYCNATISNNIISNNTSVYRGGGIAHRSGLITGNVITGNYGGEGAGGIDCDGYSPTITHCLIAGNTTGEGDRFSESDGGGICCRNNCDPTITHCTIAANKAQGNYSRGGGIYCTWGNIKLKNCIFWGNQGLLGNELYIGGSWTDVTVSYSNVEGGADAAYIGGDGVLNWAEGNIDSDPCFADPGHWDANGTPEDVNDDFWVDGDYHLKSQAGRWDANSESWVRDDVTSPCIDAGNPGCPVGDEPSPNGNRRNIGAYGGTAEASKSPPYWRSIADMTNDWIVDSNDLKVFVSYWLETGECIPGDFDRNRSVDSNDFAIFAGQWRQIGPGPAITYEVGQCIPIEPLLSTSGEAGPTRFTVTVEGSNIRFEDLITANCCADEIELLMTVEDGLITIYEIEHTPMPPCPCICDYPITATLGPFEPGTYTFEVYQGEGFIGTTTVNIAPGS